MSETIKRKPVATTIENETSLFLINSHNPLPGLSSTPQTIFNDSCSSRNTPIEPSTRSTMLTMAANIPADLLAAPFRIVSIIIAPSGPTKFINSENICPFAASSPKKKPAIAITIINSGPSENAE